MTNATNPFIAIVPYARTFGAIAFNTFINEEAKAFYGECFDAARDLCICRWEAHAIAVLQAYEIAMELLVDTIGQVKTPRLMPVAIAGYLPPAKVRGLSWMEWKLFLMVLFGGGGF